MNRWIGKVAVVTGASSGIGAAIAVDLVKAGVIVVGLARRPERIELLKNSIPDELKGKLHSFKCDVTKEEDIKNAFKWVETNVGGADILINNAGIVLKANLLDEDNTDIMKKVIDTNLIGVVLCTREAFQSMKRRGITDGHIVIINSVAGHSVTYLVGKLPSFHIYHASKHAVTALTESLRQELQSFGTKIKITVFFLKSFYF